MCIEYFLLLSVTSIFFCSPAPSFESETPDLFSYICKDVLQRYVGIKIFTTKLIHDTFHGKKSRKISKCAYYTLFSSILRLQAQQNLRNLELRREIIELWIKSLNFHGRNVCIPLSLGRLIHISGKKKPQEFR